MTLTNRNQPRARVMTTTNEAAEQLRKTIRACGGFSNDHDYIARARPVDLINAAKEIDDLTARLDAAGAALSRSEECLDDMKDICDEQNTRLAAAQILLRRCYDAGHREGWQDGETNAEVFSDVSDYLENTK